MIEPVNKITCDWCGKYELMATETLPKEFFVVTISGESGSNGTEYPEVEKILICTACRNSIESVKNLRMKERREKKSSSPNGNLHWPAPVERQYFGKRKACI